MWNLWGLWFHSWIPAETSLRSMRSSIEGIEGKSFILSVQTSTAARDVPCEVLVSIFWLNQGFVRFASIVVMLLHDLGQWRRCTQRKPLPKTSHGVAFGSWVEMKPASFLISTIAPPLTRIDSKSIDEKHASSERSKRATRPTVAPAPSNVSPRVPTVWWQSSLFACVW